MHSSRRHRWQTWQGFPSSRVFFFLQSSLIDLKEHASSLASAGLKRDSKLKSLEIAIEQKKEECSKLEAQLKKVSEAEGKGKPRSFCNEFIKLERKGTKPLIFLCLLIKELNTLNFIPKKSASNLSVNLKNYLRFPI